VVGQSCEGVCGAPPFDVDADVVVEVVVDVVAVFDREEVVVERALVPNLVLTDCRALAFSYVAA
jgi:hypothetical protein